MINRFAVVDAAFQGLKMPDVDTSKLTRDMRETNVQRDQFGTYHITQKKDGLSHIVSLDQKELTLLLLALHDLTKKGD